MQLSLSSMILFLGLIWNKIGTEFDNWEVELTFKIAGRGRVGADGLVCRLHSLKHS